METIVKLEGVTKDYGSDGVIVHALRSVDLEISKGEFVAVAGPSGSGKSTLLNIISGLDQPTRGKVEVDGKELSGMSRSKLSKLRLHSIGFVFQSYNLLPVLTVYENAEYVLLLQGVPVTERRDRIMQLLKQVGLEGMENRFPRELSGGQQQRVAIARAIASKPSLVLADEPTANVDSVTAAAIMDLMLQLNKEKKATFLFSTHDQNVMKRSRRLILLKDGAINQNGKAQELEENG